MQVAHYCKLRCRLSLDGMPSTEDSEQGQQSRSVVHNHCCQLASTTEMKRSTHLNARALTAEQAQQEEAGDGELHVVDRQRGCTCRLRSLTPRTSDPRSVTPSSVARLTPNCSLHLQEHALQKGGHRHRLQQRGAAHQAAELLRGTTADLACKGGARHGGHEVVRV